MNSLSPIQKPLCPIIIPAYNEESVIANTLKTLLADAALQSDASCPDRNVEIIIACNGCKDRTATFARLAAPEADVLEIRQAGKAEALNIALKKARGDYIVFLDADIETSGATIIKLLTALQTSGAAMAYGRADYCLKGCSAAVRHFFKVWQLSPYFDARKVGGLFAVSRAGLRKIAPFPNVTNDDEWVRRRLEGKGIYVAEAPYRIRFPHRLADLIGVRARVYRGNEQLDYSGMATARTESAKFTLLKRVLARPATWPSFAVFCFVAWKAWTRRYKGAATWNQDKSARAAVACAALNREFSQ